MNSGRLRLPTTFLLLLAAAPARATDCPAAGGGGPIAEISDVVGAGAACTSLSGDAAKRAVAWWLVGRAWGELPVPAADALTNGDDLVTVARLRSIAADPRRSEADRAGAQAVLDLLSVFDTASGIGQPDGKIGFTDALAIAQNGTVDGSRFTSAAATALLARIVDGEFATIDNLSMGGATDGKIGTTDLARVPVEFGGMGSYARMVRQAGKAMSENFCAFDGPDGDGLLTKPELRAAIDWRAIPDMSFDVALAVGFYQMVTRTGPRSWELRTGDKTRWLGWGEDKILTLTDADGTAAHRYLDLDGLDSPASELVITEAARSLRIALDGPRDVLDGRFSPSGQVGWYIHQLAAAFGSGGTPAKVLDTSYLSYYSYDPPSRRVQTVDGIYLVGSDGNTLTVVDPAGKKASLPFKAPAPYQESALNAAALIKTLYSLQAELADD